MTARGRCLWAVLLLTGCVSLTPAQENRLADLQRFADKVTEAYDKPRVSIAGIEPLSGAAASTRDGGLTGLVSGRPGLIFLAPRHIENRLGIALLAHELGHWVLGHARPTFDERPEAVRVEMELAANREAVRILEVGADMPPRLAFGYVFLLLDSVARDRLAGRLKRAKGHPADPCAEVYNLVDHFPAYRASVRRIDQGQRAKGETPLACPPQ